MNLGQDHNGFAAQLFATSILECISVNRVDDDVIHCFHSLAISHGQARLLTTVLVKRASHAVYVLYS